MESVKQALLGPLDRVMGALETNIDKLTEVFHFFETRPQPLKPDHPRALSSLLLCSLLLSNLLMIERQAYWVTGGVAQAPSRGPSLRTALAVTNKWVNDYKGKRSALVHWRRSGGTTMGTRYRRRNHAPATRSSKTHQDQLGFGISSVTVRSVTRSCPTWVERDWKGHFRLAQNLF